MFKSQYLKNSETYHKNMALIREGKNKDENNFGGVCNETYTHIWRFIKLYF